MIARIALVLFMATRIVAGIPLAQWQSAQNRAKIGKQRAARPVVGTPVVAIGE